LTPPSNCTVWHCPVCHDTLISTPENSLLCSACHRFFPILDGIPVFVEHPEKHLDELTKAIETNPAWYQSSQIAWYDHGPCRHHLARRRRYVESALAKRLGKNGQVNRLLDLGCGDGANTRWLKHYAEQIDACDYSLLRLRRCQELVGASVNFSLADVHQLPWADDTFDVIFFNHVLEHIPNDTGALHSVRRVLKPGGLLILGVPNEGAFWWQLAYRLQPESRATSDHVHFYTISKIERKAQDCGFILEQTHRTGWGPPHWKLDEKMRQFRRIDNAFEWFGAHFLKNQCSSLYLLLVKE
jgi:ubiquinone/menaquinone biosynthesis C-methylase UbiE/uncharacterized protein YbaR (Trm112 family)